jgi:hypothetical protein
LAGKSQRLGGTTSFDITDNRIWRVITKDNKVLTPKGSDLILWIALTQVLSPNYHLFYSQTFPQIHLTRVKPSNSTLLSAHTMNWTKSGRTVFLYHLLGVVIPSQFVFPEESSSRLRINVMCLEFPGIVLL